ncbi:MAG: hypothetical protein DMG49_07510 [Acidobacteria bacterium]|nr:MAG: hypothetical protein DMG49_07510 [Acidobacteriota bacterium]
MMLRGEVVKALTKWISARRSSADIPPWIARPDAVEDSFNIAHPVGLHDVFYVGQRPGVCIARCIPAHPHPRAFQPAKGSGMPFAVDLRQHRRIFGAALSFHPLRQPLLQPRGGMTMCLLLDKAVG